MQWRQQSVDRLHRSAELQRISRQIHMDPLQSDGTKTVDAEFIRDLFRPFGAVTVRRMFGGAGLFADGVCSVNDRPVRVMSALPRAPVAGEDFCAEPNHQRQQRGEAY